MGILICAIASLGSCKLHVDAPADTFRANLNTEPPTLDWALATDSASITVLENIMEGLTGFDADMIPRPALAESWTVSDDGMTYTFRIRDKVKWTDGVELEAKQFVDGWRRILEPATAAEYAYFLYDVENAEAFNQGQISDFSRVGVSAPDERTLVVRLRKPIVFFPAIVTFIATYPARLDVVERWDNRWTEPEHIVTLGPYRLKSWRHEYKIELERNESYHGRRPEVDRVLLYMIEEPNTALDLYESGTLDYASLPPYTIPFYKHRNDYRHLPHLSGYYYGFNVTRPPFDNPLVRQAFSMAVDRNVLRRILHGSVVPATSWIPPGLIGYNPELGLKYDPRQARKLIEQAGYLSTDDMPDITLAYNTNDTHKLLAENIKEQWQNNLGVHVRLDNMEWKVYLQQLKSDPAQIFRLGWNADYPDPDNFMAMFLGNSGNNHTRWINREFDRLVGMAAAEADTQKRKKLYDRAQRILVETDCAIMPLFFASQNRLIAKRVEGLELNVMDMLFLDRVRLKP